MPLSAASALAGEFGTPSGCDALERYAVHKLIVAHRRVLDRAKALKDQAQAAQLIEALWTIQRADLLAVLRKAVERGPAWRLITR
jgi:hypothetical protein